MGRHAIFSDIDGTLVHLSRDLGELGTIADGGFTFTPSSGRSLAIRPLPPSSTGLQGYISERTLSLVARLRRAGHVFVLISGARASTFMERLPYLPAADAYVMENGGRIFLQASASALPTAAPLVEDMEWRATHVAAGPAAQLSTPPQARIGALWELYCSLMRNGWDCNAKGYSTDFRVSLSKSKGKTEADLRRIIADLPSTLACSFNLGSADFYPATSGKDMAAQYLMRKFGVPPEQSVSFGDDDNDLSLAMLVSHTYVPGFTSASVRAAVAAADPGSFTVATVGGFEGTDELLAHAFVDLGGSRAAQTVVSAVLPLAALVFVVGIATRRRRG